MLDKKARKLSMKRCISFDSYASNGYVSRNLRPVFEFSIVSNAAPSVMIEFHKPKETGAWKLRLV